MKEISIIIPCYNVECYIDECVSSLVNQTFGIEKMELIFVNDASTDHTLEKLAVWEQQYSDSIVVINLLENGKTGAARNVGMEYATGTYIGFVDADDYVELNMYQKMYEYYQNEEVDCVICSRYNQESEEQYSVLGSRGTGTIDLTNEKYHNTLLHLYTSGRLVQRLYKRQWLMDLQVWFPEGVTYEDNFFICIVNYYTNKVGFINQPLYHYRIHSATITKQKNSLHHLERLKVEVMKLEELMNRGLYLVYREDIEFEFLRWYFVNPFLDFLKLYDEIPEGVVLEMQKTVKGLFPQWKQNPLLQSHKMEASICQLIDFPFRKGDKKEVVIVYYLTVCDEEVVTRDEELYAEKIYRLCGSILIFMNSVAQGQVEKYDLKEDLEIDETDDEFKILLELFVKKMKNHMRECIYYLSVLYQMTRDVNVLYSILECTKSNEIDCMTMNNIRCSIMGRLFTIDGVKRIYKQEREFHRVLLEKWEKEYGEIVDHIPFEQRNKNTILITTDQFLGFQHAPSKIIVNVAEILMNAGFKVELLVNYTYYEPVHMYQLLMTSNLPNCVEELYGKFEMECNGLKIPYMQVNFSRNTRQVIKEVHDYIDEIKPAYVWHIGGESFISDLIGRCSTMISSNCSDGLSISEAQILAYTSNMAEPMAIQYAKEQQQRVCQYICPISTTYKKQGVNYTRQQFRLPEDKYLICIVGNRLNDEVDNNFLYWMEELVDYSEDFMFVSVGNADTIWRNSSYKNRIIHLGYQEKLTDILGCMDVFVNPPRRGGGGGATAALAAGIPAFTLSNCDVANIVPSEFIAKNLDEMKEFTIECYKNKMYYEAMCDKACIRFEDYLKESESGNVQKSIIQLFIT